MTEDEAKAKWCPFARVIQCGEDGDDNEKGVHNRIDWCSQRADDAPSTDGIPDKPSLMLHESMLCIGSACMAWRWRDGICPLPNDPPTISERYSGYCGLAGKP